MAAGTGIFCATLQGPSAPCSCDGITAVMASQLHGALGPCRVAQKIPAAIHHSGWRPRSKMLGTPLSLVVETLSQHVAPHSSQTPVQHNLPHLLLLNCLYT